MILFALFAFLFFHRLLDGPLASHDYDGNCVRRENIVSEGKNQKYSKILPNRSFALAKDKRLKPLIKLTMSTKPTYFSGQETSCAVVVSEKWSFRDLFHCAHKCIDERRFLSDSQCFNG
jgi:hypothetical protein